MSDKPKRAWVKVVVVVGVVVLVAAGFGVYQLFIKPKGEVTAECVDRYFTSTDTEAGFHELLDAQKAQTWGAQDVSEVEWDALELPAAWKLWIKNTPRELMSRGVFLRSPACPEDGQFTWKTMFDHDWMNVADFKDMNTPVDEAETMTKTTMNKFHRLTYDAGNPVWYITSPEGERFVVVTRDYERTTDTPTLPEGWTMSKEMTLDKEMLVDLMGDEIANYRVSNGDSFQGPLPDSLQVEDYAS